LFLVPPSESVVGQLADRPPGGAIIESHRDKRRTKDKGPMPTLLKRKGKKEYRIKRKGPIEPLRAD